MKTTKRILALLMALIMAFAMQTAVIAQEQTQAAEPAVAATQEQTQTSTPAGEASAQAETPEAVAVPVDQPSAWAFEEVNWSAIYGLAHQSMYSQYTANVTRQQLYAVGANLYQRITGKVITPLEKSPFTDTDNPAILAACAIGIIRGQGILEPEKEATRLEMVTMIYDVLKSADAGLSFDTDVTITSADAGKIPVNLLDEVEYAVAKGLLKGVGNNSLGLSKACSRQELMIFAKRAYEFFRYETGTDSKGLLWKASDEDSTVYLLGSVHVADPFVYPLSKAMLSAFEASDSLVVEADIANQNEGAAYMQQKMMYTGEDTLDKNVPKEVYDSFVKVVSPLGILEAYYNKLKPWAAASIVQSVQMAQNSYVASLGVDLYFLSKAAGYKSIVEIEGIRFQVDMFESFSKELQTVYLASVLTPDESYRQLQTEILDSMINAWKTGDAAEIEKLVAMDTDGSLEAKEFNEKMWTTRNQNMYEKTKTYLADPDKKTYFIVVGAGHMQGENGVVTQLEANGYNVEQVE